MSVKKKLIFLLLLISSLLILPVSAHPGRTDSRGGHHDSTTGEYHYHHGHSAHQHEDLDGDGILECPYNFDDQTGSRSGSSSNTDSTALSKEKSERTFPPILIPIICLAVVWLLCWAFALIDFLIQKLKNRPKR